MAHRCSRSDFEQSQSILLSLKHPRPWVMNLDREQLLCLVEFYQVLVFIWEDGWAWHHSQAENWNIWKDLLFSCFKTVSHSCSPGWPLPLNDPLVVPSLILGLQVWATIHSMVLCDVWSCGLSWSTCVRSLYVVLVLVLIRASLQCIGCLPHSLVSMKRKKSCMALQALTFGSPKSLTSFVVTSLFWLRKGTTHSNFWWEIRCKSSCKKVRQIER